MKHVISIFLLYHLLPAAILADEYNHFISAKYGSYTINNSNQTTTYAIDDYRCGYFCGGDYIESDPVDLYIDKHSHIGGAIEYEYIFVNGLSLGGEWAIFDNKYKSSINNNQEGTIRTTFLNINIKKYLNRSGSLRPFFGAGTGFAIAEFDGPIQGDVSGFTLNARLGVLYQMGRIGICTEFMYINGLGVDATIDEDSKKGDISGDYNLDGYVIFAGIRIGI